jgi:hypothetical protein
MTRLSQLMLPVVNTSRSLTHSLLITGFVTRLTRLVPLVEQELPTLPEHLSSPPVFSGARGTRFLVLCVCFLDRCLHFFFWPLCCLFFDIRILITPLVSSNSSYNYIGDVIMFDDNRQKQSVSVMKGKYI